MNAPGLGSSGIRFQDHLFTYSLPEYGHFFLFGCFLGGLAQPCANRALKHCNCLWYTMTSDQGLELIQRTSSRLPDAGCEITNIITFTSTKLCIRCEQ